MSEIKRWLDFISLVFVESVSHFIVIIGFWTCPASALMIPSVFYRRYNQVFVAELLFIKK